MTVGAADDCSARPCQNGGTCRDGVAAAGILRLDVRRLAKAAGLSPFQFVRSFEGAYGMTPGRLVQRVRLERARDLLVRGTSVTSACFEVGYASLGSFSATFQRRS